MKQWQTQVINTLGTALATGMLAYFGLMAPQQQQTQAAVDQCCPLARECMGMLDD